MSKIVENIILNIKIDYIIKTMGGKKKVWEYI